MLYPLGGHLTFTGIALTSSMVSAKVDGLIKDQKTMEEIQNKVEQDPNEKLAEEEALKEVPEDTIRSEVIEKYGLTEDDNSELIDKLVGDTKEEQKKLSTAIRQKIDWRTKAQTPKE